MYVTTSPSSDVSRSDLAAENKGDRQSHEGWSKMVHQEIQDEQNELLKAMVLLQKKELLQR
jgi:hypothetical protein